MSFSPSSNGLHWSNWYDFLCMKRFATMWPTSEGRVAMTDQQKNSCGTKPAWSKPRLDKVGSIRDIAVRNFPNNQAANSKKS